MIRDLKKEICFLRRALKAGQTILEYAVLIALVSAAVTTMALYVRRAVQGQLYKIEERITGKMTDKDLPAPTQPTPPEHMP